MTKAKARIKELYHYQLKRCGFTSWWMAYKRRCELIMRFIPNDLTGEECEECDRLQRLADLYVSWSGFDFYKNQNQKLNNIERFLGHIK